MSRPVRPVRLGPREIAVEHGAGGVLRLRSTAELGRYPEKMTERLDHWAATAPDRVFLAQRDGGGSWQKYTYAEVRDGARRVAQSLLNRKLSAERPVAVLSGNDIEHALIMLGAMYAGVPYAPVSPAYSLFSGDFAKLKSIIDLLTPGLVYASMEGAFGRAIDAAVPPGAEVVFKESFHLLEQKKAGAAVDEAHSRVTADTVVKFLFTSGSTGTPKAVINTQRMWCSNQQMIRTMLAYFQDEPPLIVDWAPWHHTAAGNHDFGLVLFNGGTYYIDEGKPVGGAIDATVRNLREISPTWYFTVPKGYEMLLPHLRRDNALRANFFQKLKVLWFAGAGLSQHAFDEMKQLAFDTCGEEIQFLTGLGSTETAPYALGRTWPSADASNMGLPPPGVELKLVPFENKYEARLKGPSITPGYWRQPELTAAAFDEEGYYRLGDAFDFDDIRQGLIYRGRISEDFKLATGTWVHVGTLRTRFIEHFAPLVRDVVIAGEGRNELAALIFPNVEALQRQQKPRDRFRQLLASFEQEAAGSSTRIVRAAVLEEPPSLDAGEITDKGTVNQKAVLARRRKLLDELYSLPATGRTILY